MSIPRSQEFWRLDQKTCHNWSGRWSLRFTKGILYFFPNVFLCFFILSNYNDWNFWSPGNSQHGFSKFSFWAFVIPWKKLMPCHSFSILLVILSLTLFGKSATKLLITQEIFDIPKRLDESKSEKHVFQSVQEFYRKKYFYIYDQVTASLIRRFDTEDNQFFKFLELFAIGSCTVEIKIIYFFI